MPERSVFRKTAAIPEIMGLGGALFNWSNAKLLAAAMLTGGAAGYLASKLTAKGEADMDTARKAYQNERAMADIGYLRSRLADEYTKARAEETEKPMRMV